MSKLSNKIHKAINSKSFKMIAWNRGRENSIDMERVKFWIAVILAKNFDTNFGIVKVNLFGYIADGHHRAIAFEIVNAERIKNGEKPLKFNYLICDSNYLNPVDSNGNLDMKKFVCAVSKTNDKSTCWTPNENFMTAYKMNMSVAVLINKQRVSLTKELEVEQKSIPTNYFYSFLTNKAAYISAGKKLSVDDYNCDKTAKLAKTNEAKNNLKFFGSIYTKFDSYFGKNDLNKYLKTMFQGVWCKSLKVNPFSMELFVDMLNNVNEDKLKTALKDIKVSSTNMKKVLTDIYNNKYGYGRKTKYQIYPSVKA